MMQTLLFAVGASVPLIAGAALAIVWRPPKKLVAALLAFATGALLASTAFELFEPAYRDGGLLRAGLGFAAGALVFVGLDTLLEKYVGGSAVGWALLAGVTLDGVPENAALGVTLVEGGSIALLVAVFASNFPEALGGAHTMLDGGRSRRTVLLVWGGATVLLAVAVLVGRFAVAGASPAQLALPLAFAAGAVLASLVDTLAPEAYEQGGPVIALASAAGFLTAFVLGA